MGRWRVSFHDLGILTDDAWCPNDLRKVDRWSSRGHSATTADNTSPSKRRKRWHSMHFSVCQIWDASCWGSYANEPHVRLVLYNSLFHPLTCFSFHPFLFVFLLATLPFCAFLFFTTDPLRVSAFCVPFSPFLFAIAPGWFIGEPIRNSRDISNHFIQ